MDGRLASPKSEMPNSLWASLQHLWTSSVRVIGSGNGFTTIVQSHIRSQALTRMPRSSYYWSAVHFRHQILALFDPTGFELRLVLQRIQGSGQPGEEGRRTILAHSYWGRCAPFLVTSPPARSLTIPGRDCYYRWLRAKKLILDWSLCPPIC